MTEEEIQKRIGELRELAKMDSLPVKEDSVTDFLYYLKFNSFATKFEGPYIFLTDDGNIRAMWKTFENSSIRREIRLEFHGLGKATLMWMPSKPRDKPVQQVS